MTTPALDILIQKRLDSFKVDAACSIPAGITILFGPSGAGKTTLLDCVAGLTRPDSGHIAIGNRAFFDDGQGVNIPPQRRGIGYVFQDLALFPHLSVEKNLHYGLAHLNFAERDRRAGAILESFRISHLRA